MKLEDQVSRWKQLPGFEGLYEVGNNGCIRSLTRSGSNGRILKQHLVRGYYQVWLSKNNKITKLSVHRSVLMAFDRLPNQQEVCNHKDGNKLNNNIENLEWCSREANEKHKRDVLGEDSKGVKNGNYGYRHAKLYPSDELRNKLCALGVPRFKHNLAELGEIFPNVACLIYSCNLSVGETKEWRCIYAVEGREGVLKVTHEETADTEANARAAMLVYLIEHGIVKP